MQRFKIRHEYLFKQREVLDVISEQEQQFYVYVLIDPLTRSPIYVGKGQGLRCLSHWNHRDKKGSTRIRRVLSNFRKTPLYFLFNFYSSEKESYDAESGLIIKLGLKHIDEYGTLYNSNYGEGEQARSKSWSDVLPKFKETHGDLYDYSKVVYKGYAHTIEVICKKHGSFWTGVGRHRKGQGCPECGTESTSNKLRKPKQQLIEQLKSVHSKSYDYSKVKYLSHNEQVEIICKEHGSFWQSPGSHLKGRGCPKCGLNRLKGPRIVKS